MKQAVWSNIGTNYLMNKMSGIGTEYTYAGIVSQRKINSLAVKISVAYACGNILRHTRHLAHLCLTVKIFKHLYLKHPYDKQHDRRKARKIYKQLSAHAHCPPRGTVCFFIGFDFIFTDIRTH